MNEKQINAIRDQVAMLRFNPNASREQMKALAEDAPLLAGEPGEIVVTTPDRERALHLACELAKYKTHEGHTIKTEVTPSQSFPGQWEVLAFVKSELDVFILNWRMGWFRGGER